MKNGSVALICNMPLVITNVRQIVDCLEFGRQAQHVKLAPKQNVASSGESDFHKLKEMMQDRVNDAETQRAAALEMLKLPRGLR